MNANFAGLATSIRDDQADTIERELQALRMWAADIERYDAATSQISADAEQAARLIQGNLGAADVVAIASALFRALAKNAHITTHRDAMACLVDIAADFAGEVEEERASSEVQAGKRDPDDAYDEWRENRSHA
jgi:hypothetical protein